MICMRHFLAEVLPVKPHSMNLELRLHGPCLLVLLLLSQFYISRGHRIRVNNNNNTANSNKVSVTTHHIPLQKRKTRQEILKALTKAAQLWLCSGKRSGKSSPHTAGGSLLGKRGSLFRLCC